ncbi:MAG: twin-arginine translocase TatA/TatE family subunit [Candidatus Latescibacterota bacterium]
MFGIGHWEIFIILLVALLIFGAKRIPEMAQGLGKGIREFRKAMRDVQDEIDVENTSRTASRPQIQPAAPRQAIPQQPAPAAQTAAAETAPDQAGPPPTTPTA